MKFLGELRVERNDVKIGEMIFFCRPIFLRNFQRHYWVERQDDVTIGRYFQEISRNIIGWKGKMM